MALKLSDVLFNSDRNFEILMKFQLNDEEELLIYNFNKKSPSL
jgi:hypothetical protein